MSGRADEADDLPGGDVLADGDVGLDELVAVVVDVSAGQDFAVGNPASSKYNANSVNACGGAGTGSTSRDPFDTTQKR